MDLTRRKFLSLLPIAVFAYSAPSLLAPEGRRFDYVSNYTPPAADIELPEGTLYFSKTIEINFRVSIRGAPGPIGTTITHEKIF